MTSQPRFDDYLSRWLNIPDEERGAVIEAARAIVGNAKWTPNPGPQTQAYFCAADQLLYGGEAGGGKGVPSHATVATPFGWRRAGALKVGDAICATDGTITKVIGVYRRGVQPTWRLRWSDGAETVCDEDHIWRGWWAGKPRKIANKPTFGEDAAANWTTREIIAKMAKPSARRFAIPVISAPCVFNVAGEAKGATKFLRRDIHPYVLGVLLGDGCFRGTSVTWTKPDVEIADRIEAIIGCKVSRSASTDRCPAFTIPHTAGIKSMLEDFGLWGQRSEGKFIPRIYLLGSVDERWELLRGLMDTDGWAEEDGDCYYCSTSEQLAHNVRHLARSLGAIVTWRERDPTFSYKNEIRDGLHAYTLRIKMRQPERMFTLQRKAERCAGKEPQHMALFLESIEPAGDAETICIRVRHANALYIVDDFVVTHNTDLVIGLSTQEHRRSLLLRRVNKDVSWLVDRAAQILGTRKGFNGQDDRWTLADGRVIDFAGCQHPGDEERNKGRPKDFIGVDEATDFLESQVEFILGWLRSTEVGQRCRAVFATNPPTTVEGEWVVRWFAPWVDPSHPLYPYPMGKLLWTCRGADDEWLWFMEPGEATFEANGEPVTKPTISRTFIRSGLGDNPDLAKTSYGVQLSMLPEHLRRRYADGNFTAEADDPTDQVIPTEWIRQAQARWTKQRPADTRMTSIGVDVAQGGKDKTCLAPRYGDWFDELTVLKGVDTKDGPSVASEVLKVLRDGAQVNIDLGGGWGGSAYDHLKTNEFPVYGVVPSAGSTHRTQDGRYTFLNLRAEMWWLFREALDPNSQNKIALPPSPQLRADLASPRWKKVRGGGNSLTGVIQIELKAEIKKRLGRSPDEGDAVVMAWASGKPRKHTAKRGAALPTTANSGYADFKSRMRASHQSRRR